MSDLVKSNANKILKEYLNQHGITQKFVAEKVGMTQAQFSWRITGRTKFNADFAIAVSKVLGISTSLFLN